MSAFIEVAQKMDDPWCFYVFITGSANEAPHAPPSLHPHLVHEHLSNNVIVTTSMATPIHNGQMCKF